MATIVRLLLIVSRRRVLASDFPAPDCRRGGTLASVFLFVIANGRDQPGRDSTTQTDVRVRVLLGLGDPMVTGAAGLPGRVQIE